MDKYKIVSFIGEGSFGRVFKVTNRETNSTFALKVIRKIGRSLKDLKNLRQECDIQQHLRHPNIIRMIESFDTDSELVVVTEFAEKELHDILGREGCLPESKAQILTWDLVSALYYLHSHRVLHRDLKPQNVLIDANGHAKLCDFGLARNMTSGTHVLTSIKGTPLYMAPELIDEKPYDHQADLWSLGCIVYEMMSGQPPFFTTSIVQLVRLIRRRPILWPAYISPLAISFLQGLLHKDPTLRLSWPEILTQPFVAGKIFILPENSSIESPFTLPLSKSQMAAKQLQKERLNSIQKYMPQAVKILSQREKQRRGNIPTGHDDITSDGNRIGIVSEQESIRTDDELAPIPDTRPELKNDYTVLNQDNLIISNLNTNIAELTLQPRIDVPSISNKDERNEKLDNKNTEQNICEQNLVENNCSTEINKKKLSQNLDNFSIRLKSGSNAETQIKQKEDSPEKEIILKTSNKLPKDSSLSRSVPPTFKQKIIQFSREKFGSGSGNRLTRSLKKSFHLSKSGEKDKERRMSEPVPSTVSKLSMSATMESCYEDKEEKRDDDIKEISENSKLDDTNSCDGQTFFDDDCNPIEKDEWLAFMRSNMNEVMEGDVESLTQQNFVSMIVSVARHNGLDAEVYGTLAALLSLPMVAPHVTRQCISDILKVYIEVKLVPNLVYAARLLIRQSVAEAGEDKTSNCVSKLSNEEKVALCRLIELTSQLCLQGISFVQQLCDAVAILNTAPLMTQFLLLGDKSLRIVLNTMSMMIAILHDLPENAELVESILFEGETVDICMFLVHPSDVLKIRTCVLMGLLFRYCCSALSNYLSAVWGKKKRDSLEILQTNSNPTLSRAAKSAVNQLSKLPFYKQK